MFHAYPGEFIGECPLCWIGVRLATLLSLIVLVLVLVLGLLALIRICVTALRITLCVWGAATFIAFIFIENVIMRYSSSPGAGLAAAAARGPSGGE